jgi:Domain of unknown function (DUF4192)
MTTEPTMKLRAPSDLLAAIPYLVGYHPDDSVVVVGLHGRRLAFSARVDLPDVSGIPLPVTVDHLLEVVRRQHCTAVFIVGFGPADRTDPLLTELRRAYGDVGLWVQEVLRAHDGRFWSYVCQNTACCPPEGVPYDPVSSPLAAEWTLAGFVARRNRAEYEAQLEPVTGAAREAVTLATTAAHDGLIDLLAGVPDEEAAGRALLAAGDAALTTALDLIRVGSPLSDEDVAWLSVLLVDEGLRDLAWLRIVRAGIETDLHRALWNDVLRRCEPDLVTAPAILYGFAAWRCGEGGIARLAFDRALDQDPGCGLARQLAAALHHGVPPSAFDDLAGDGVRPRRATRRRRRSSSGRVGSRPA